MEATPGYRFIPAADRLEVLFRLYEDARRTAGVGTTLHRISPGQRLDTIEVILGLNACSGWRRVGGESAESLWLRHLTPVLAETREAAAALRSAVEQCLPGAFEPAIGDAPPPKPALSAAPPPSPAAQTPAWRRKPGLWLESARHFLFDKRTLAALALIAAIGAGALYQYADVPVDQPPAIDGQEKADVQPQPGPNSAKPGAGDSPTEMPDQAGDDYRAALALTLGAAQQFNGEITPRQLARIYAGESDTLSEPAMFLSAMLQAYSLPADAPIPRSATGWWALARYAAAFSAIETGSPMPAFSSPPLDGNRPDNARLLEALQAFADEREVGPRQRGEPATWPGWLRWLTFLPLIPVVIWSIATFVPAVKAGLVNARTKSTGTPAFLPVDAMASLVALPPERRLGRQIGWNTPVEGRRLHVDRSIRATLKRGGYLTPVRRLRAHTAAYVFLVPRRRHDDHERDRASRLIDALERGGVSLDVYDYDPDPRWLYPRPVRGSTEPASSSATAAERNPALQRLDLRGLRERHPDARLVLITDGSELVDYFTQRPHAFAAEELATWPMRVLLTPTPLGEWGEREMNLADALGAPIGRATIDGFRDLAKIFGSRPRGFPKPAPVPQASTPADMVERLVAWLSAGAGFTGQRDSIDARPRLLRFDDPALTSDAEPPAAERDAVVAALKSWLGPRGFQWLAACAAYPQLRFAVTLYLGLTLSVRFGPISQPLYDETLLAQLTLLPWFRIGRMPPWLRKSLFAALPEGARSRARAAIDTMLNERAEASRTELPIWRPDSGGLDVPPDAVMADLLMRDISDVTPVLRGKALRELFGRAARKALLTRIGLMIGAALWCAAAAWFFPAVQDAPHPNGTWLPLIALVAATIVALLVLLAGRSLYGRFGPA